MEAIMQLVLCYRLSRTEGGIRRTRLQDSQTKDTDKTYLLAFADVELPDERGGDAQNGNVQQNIGHTAAHVHYRVVRRGYAGHPIATKRPYLEEGCKDE